MSDSTPLGSDSIPLGPGGEFDRIRSIWRVLGDRAVAGGDDCAIVQVGAETLAVSVDASVQDTHFRVGWLDYREIGWRAAAAALSDLAAVAARPEGVLVGLGVPPELPDELVAEIMDGVGDAADSVGALVWGGDLYRNRGISVGVTVVGRFDGAPLRRSGARVGDGLWVTGVLGGPAAALTSFLAGEQPSEEWRARFAHPEPRIGPALWLRDRGATAMIDLSDGVASDAAHLAAASGVRVTIDVAGLPGMPGTPTNLLVTGGEEYELLFTTPDFTTERAAEFESEFGLKVSRIGEIVAGSGLSLSRAGKPYDPPAGFQHFT